jgi:hypothetical protein
MAVCSRDSLNRAVFGSTTHRVIQLGCPVLAVHVGMGRAVNSNRDRLVISVGVE